MNKTFIIENDQTRQAAIRFIAMERAFNEGYLGVIA